ncbi:UNVERIFIED_CONTAM: hypothetical protein FKN15_039766 [Acipenser sinensis]
MRRSPQSGVWSRTGSTYLSINRDSYKFKALAAKTEDEDDKMRELANGFMRERERMRERRGLHFIITVP